MTNPTTDEMERIVYEAITGKCWHDFPVYILNNINDTKSCHKCGQLYTARRPISNPPLSTSIDAWHEHIFPVMSDEQKYNHRAQLFFICNNDPIWEFEATPMHHLTAAYADRKSVV